VAQAERQQLSAMGVDASLIRVIPNPIDLSEFAAPIAAGRFRQRFALPSGPLVLFLGRLTPRKRLDVIARAFARLRHTEAWLVIAGNDMGAGAAAQSLVRTLGLDTRTRFTGLLRGSERLEALADADVMVYPSEDEIFGLAPLESLLAGTPVIVADDSGCGEVIGATGGGQVVPPGDVDALARAIDAMLDDRAAWRAAAAGAAGRVRALYGDAAVCASIEQLYGEMIANA
jgi:glycosyltransferase involved in cell wall biosynthesis